MSKSSSRDSECQFKNGKSKKTYTCEICGQEFLRSYQLNRHNFIGIHERKISNGSRVNEQADYNATQESEWYNIVNVFHEMETYFKCPFWYNSSTNEEKNNNFP